MAEKFAKWKPERRTTPKKAKKSENKQPKTEAQQTEAQQTVAKYDPEKIKQLSDMIDKGKRGGVEVLKCDFCDEPALVMCGECEDSAYCGECDQDVHQGKMYEKHEREKIKKKLKPHKLTGQRILAPFIIEGGQKEYVGTVLGEKEEDEQGRRKVRVEFEKGGVCFNEMGGEEKNTEPNTTYANIENAQIGRFRRAYSNKEGKTNRETQRVTPGEENKEQTVAGLSEREPKKKGKEAKIETKELGPERVEQHDPGKTGAESARTF